MSERLYLDFESYSACDIKKHGGLAYARHASTNMLCMGYAFDDESTELIKGIDNLPNRIEDHVGEGKPVYAHNAGFDYRIWNIVCTAQLGWPVLSLSQMVDTAALCLTFQVPPSLADAGTALNISLPKNPDGKKLIRMCCIPGPNGEQPMPLGPRRAYFERLFAYCKRDVDAMRQVVKALPREFLIPREQLLWELTYDINTLGLPVDHEAIRAIHGRLAEYIADETAKIPALCDNYFQTPGQVAKIKDWCMTQGFFIESMTAEKVGLALNDSSCPENVKRVLEMRQELGRSSVAKFTKLLDFALKGEDGRHYVHDNLQYHGAGPGRWSGRSFQMHNLPRASVPNPDEIIMQFINGEHVQDPVKKAKALIRPMVRANEDELLVVSDYSSIENKVLHWIADDFETLEDFRNGIDQYKTMASARYQVAYDQVTKEQRQMGKVIILGCIAEGTLVLTQRGPKPIELISLDDLLWDGESWVHHGGLLYKGPKSCNTFCNSWMTHDHEVFITEEKEQVWRHLDNTQSEVRAICLAIGKSLNSFREISLLSEMLATTYYAQSAETSITKFWQALKSLIRQNVAFVAEKQNTNLVWKHIVSCQDLIKKLSIDLSTDGTPLKQDVLYQTLLNTQTTEAEVFRCVKTGCQILELLLRMLWNYQDSTIQTSSSTELIMTDTMNPEILNSVRDQKIYSTHDVLNVGPNHRFTILTPKGPLLVSNCGFGMGGDKFQDTAKVQFGLDVSKADAKAAVGAYRLKYHMVKDLWSLLKTACVKAVLTGQKQTVGRIQFSTARVKGTLWLAMKLPSGKCVYYMDPQVRHMYIPDYESMGKVATVTHMGTDPYIKKWKRLKLIPGRITENAVQGTARECLAQGKLNIKNNMPAARLIGSVHDEALARMLKKFIHEGTLDEFNHNLCTVDWADGLPLTAEGWIGERYRK